MILLVLIYVMCAIITYGGVFAHFHNNFPYVQKEAYKMNMTVALIMGFIGGPIGLIMFAFGCFTTGYLPFRHGFKFY